MYTMPRTCLVTISDTNESNLNFGREIRTATIRFKIIRAKMILNEFIYAAHIMAVPMIKAESLKPKREKL
jgi:hypothetical protein